MKYEKEIKHILRELLYDSWLTEEQYQLIVKSSLEKSGVTIEYLSRQMEIGVENGYNPKEQVKLILKAYNK